MKGLRREEVALLAGISPEYYVRLERGQATGPSPGVVEAIARVLRLDEDERIHLDRVLAALVPGPRRRPRPPRAPPDWGTKPGARCAMILRIGRLPDLTRPIGNGSGT